MYSIINDNLNILFLIQISNNRFYSLYVFFFQNISGYIFQFIYASNIFIHHSLKSLCLCVVVSFFFRLSVKLYVFYFLCFLSCLFYTRSLFFNERKKNLIIALVSFTWNFFTLCKFISSKYVVKWKEHLEKKKMQILLI